MQDFGIKVSNVFFYYKDLEIVSDFYVNILGLEIVVDYEVVKILWIVFVLYFILVDVLVGMYNEKELKIVVLVLFIN